MPGLDKSVVSYPRITLGSVGAPVPMVETTFDGRSQTVSDPVKFSGGFERFWAPLPGPELSSRFPRACSCDDAGSAARQAFAGCVRRLDFAWARSYASGSYGFSGIVLRIMDGPNWMRMDAYASAAAVEWVFLRIALVPQEAQSFAIVVEAGCG